MRIAISSMGEGLNSQVSTIFGRCPYFVFVEIENKKIKEEKTMKNMATAYSGGAGISAAQFVANEKVDAMISGAVGPKAFGVLQQLGIKIYGASGGTVKENVDLFIEGKLKEVTTPGVMGRGMGGGVGQGGGFGRGRNR